ncbi:MAG: site-2 protease family protein [Thermoleophilia bacterium]
MGSTLRIGRLAGIPIGIQPLWLLVVALITYSLGHDYYPVEDPALGAGAAYALGLLSALALFGGIVLHELGHAIVARRGGVQVDEIDLWLLGGVARIRGTPRRAHDELAFALAGPAVTALLLVAAGALRLALGAGAADWLRALVEYGVFVNAAILAFNLLPAFPLDGGRVLRALLWQRSGDYARATAIAARGGRTFGIVLIALGAGLALQGLASGLWLAIVGGFLVIASGAEASEARRHEAFAATTVAEIMSAPPVSLPAGLALDAAAREFEDLLFGAFPIIDEDGRAVGILTLDEVRGVTPAARVGVAARQVASRDPELLVDGALAVDALLSRPAFARVGRAIVVDTADRPVGVVSVSDLERRLRAATLSS